MSITELKATADKLSARERAWLRAYLFAQERAADPSWKSEMAARRRRLAGGGGVNRAEYHRRMGSPAARPASSAAK